MITLQSQTDLINTTLDVIWENQQKLTNSETNNYEWRKAQEMITGYSDRLVQLLFKCREMGMEVQLIDVTPQQIWEDK